VAEQECLRGVPNGTIGKRRIGMARRSKLDGVQEDGEGAAMTMEGCWGKQNGKQSLANQRDAKSGGNGGNWRNGQKVIPKMVDKRTPATSPLGGSTWQRHGAGPMEGGDG